MFERSTLPSLCLILVALCAPVVQAVAQETITVEIGEAGQPAQDFSWTGSGASRVDLKFADNKSLSDGPGVLVFELASSSPRTYSGFLQDAAGNKILGTDFSGTSNLVPTNIDLDSETVWAGMRIDVGGGTTMPPFTLSWITRPTVGQPEGNQAPTANAGGPYTAGADVDIQFDGSGSSDPDGQITDYKWSFGDGNFGTGEKPVHRYDLGGRYTILLTVTDDAGARASAFGTGDIGTEDEPPNAKIRGGLEGYTGTVNVPIQFDGSPSRDDVGIESYRWQWQDGAGGRDGSGPMPQHAYPLIGEFTTILNVTDTSGQTDGDYTVTTVAGGNQPPVADAGPPVSGAVGVPVTFDASGSNDPEGEITQYAWDFGDETDIVTDAGPTPTHTYAEPGTYTVTVVVTDPDDPSVSDSDFTTADITGGNQLPTAEANGPYTGSVGVPVQFQATGSSDPDGSIQDYFWIFDDGNTGEGATASHTYTEGGNYQATLIVTDNDGASAADYATVSIDSDNLPPRAVAGGPYPGVPGATVTFDGTDSFDPDGEIVSYSWDFGDSGSGSGPQPTHTYAVPGVYYVVLTTVDDDGATAQDLTLAVIGRSGSNIPPTADAGGLYRGTAGVPLSFDGSASSDEDGIETYEWKFGDEGSSSFGEQVDHTYATSGFYHVTLTVKDTQGLTSSDGTIAIIGSDSEPPIADAGGPYNGTVGAPVSFDGTGSSDADGTIAAYEWKFGDESSGSGAMTSHVYEAAGTYFVTLTVTDDTGETDFDVVVVSIGVGNLPPVADPGGPYTGTAGVSVEFDGTGSVDPDGSILSKVWEFGDGNFGVGDSPSHTYAAGGIWNVTLTVVDDNGSVDSGTTTAQIAAANQPPLADAGPDMVVVDRDGAGSVIVTLDGQASSDPDGTIVSYRWRDGGSTLGQQQKIKVALPVGVHEIDLVVEDDDGATSSDTTQVTVLGINFTGASDLAVLEGMPVAGGAASASLVRVPGGENVVYLRNVANGAAVKTTRLLDTSWVAFDLAALEDANSNGSPEIAGLGVQTGTGDIAVQVRDGLSGAFVKNLFYLSSDWTPRQVLGIPSNDANPGPEVGVLAVNDLDRQIVVQVRDAATSAFVRNVFFLNNQWVPIQAFLIPGFDPNPGDEIGVLAVNRTSGQIVVSVKDMLSNTFVQNVFFLNSGWKPVSAEFIPSAGHAGPTVGLLASNRSTGQIVTQLKDASNNQFVRNIFHLGSAWTPRFLEVVPPISAPDDELSVLAVNADGKPIIQNRDAGTNAYINDVNLLGATWRVLSMVGFEGNGTPGLAVLATRNSDKAVVVQTFDAASGAQVSSVVLQ